MKSILTYLLLATSVTLFAQPTAIDAIVHVNLLTMTNEQVLTDQTILIKAGKIVKIGPSDQIKVRKKAKVIDGTGRYLLPGLTEMHAHIPTPQNGDDTEVRNVLFLYLSNGVTTIRGMLGDPYHLTLRQAVSAGQILGPRIFTSSPSMNGNSIKTPEEARLKVTQFKKEGYDFLKIHPGVKRVVFDTLVKVAKALNFPFSGHVPAEVGIRHALAAQYASVDHLDGYLEGLVSSSALEQNPNGGFFGFNYLQEVDETKLAALAQETKRQGVWVVPTQSLFTRWFSPQEAIALANEPEMQYIPSKMLFQWRQSKTSLTGGTYTAENWQQFIRLRHQIMQALQKAGVDFLLGSDAPQVFNVPGFSLRHEIQSMADARLSPYFILQSGTANPARFFGRTGSFGTIQVGAAADLILLEANPLENLNNLWKQQGVLLRGQWLSREWIDAELKRIAEKYKS